MANRKNISTEAKLRLFSEAAGHCQRPECLESLFPIEMGGARHIAEMAHVVPHGKMGPRHEERPGEEFEVDSPENLLLLCPTCHTTIDKDPDAYSRATLLAWKRNHLAALAVKQGIVAYQERSRVREVVSTAIAENFAVWRELSPESGSNADLDPESESAHTWRLRMRGVILPNHFRIQAIINANQNHLTAGEQATYSMYLEHVRGLSERHICGIAGKAIRFPPEMEKIFS